MANNQSEIEHFGPAALLTSPHAPRIEVIETVASPHNDHLSSALECLWLACKPGSCGGVSPIHKRGQRLSVSAIIHAWCAMESAVNLTLYMKLRYEGCSYYIEPKKRTAYDKKISNSFQKSYPFWERLEYLAESHKCCSLVEKSKGKIGQFEKVRNELIHGYVFRKAILAEEEVGSVTLEKIDSNTNLLTTTFNVVEQELNTPEGEPLDLSSKFRELGIAHNLTQLCRHDAAHCVQLAVQVLVWLDKHYGVHSAGHWIAHNEEFIFRTRKHKTKPALSDIILLDGQHDLWGEFNEKDKLEKEIAKKKAQREKLR